MKKVFFVRLFTLAVLGAMIVAGPPAAMAYDTYFGEDLGLGEATPLPAHPNADAARAAFFAELLSIGTETLESFPEYTYAPLSVVFMDPSGPVTATLTGDGYVAHVPVGQTNGVGRYAISGTKYWETSDVFAITFDQPVSVFGFYGVDVGDFDGQLTLTLTDGSTLTLTVPNTVGSPGGTIIYFGFIDKDNEYTSVTFGNTQPGWDYFGFDDFTVGTQAAIVPGYALDIKPGSCPNPLNFKPAKGVTPVAILGSETADVADIDPATILLEGVAPLRWAYEDVAGPVENPDPMPCECTTAGPDGYMDLTLKFSTPELVAALGSPSPVMVLTLTGMTMDGSSFELTDCIVTKPVSPGIIVLTDDPPAPGTTWGQVKAMYR